MNSLVNVWKQEAEKRRNLLVKTHAYRVVDTTPHLQSDIKIDILGPVLSVLYFDHTEPTSEIFEAVDTFSKWIGTEHWLIRLMINRGREPNQKTTWSSPNLPESWEINENQCKFLMKSTQGTSLGLFLDQRDMRDWFAHNSKGKNILNLFAYTGGFSVAASLGHAIETTTVDISSVYLNWSKENFILNNLDPAKHKFAKTDSLDFLKRSKKTEKKFDIIICDPPSFGRTTDSVFRLAKDYEKLFELMSGCLATDGIIYFSTNYERWSLQDFKRKCVELSKQFGMKILNYPPCPSDFTSEILKGCLFQNKS